MICGGSFSNATLYNKSPAGACLGCNVQANSLCSSIQPESIAPVWSYEQMRDSSVPGSAPIPRYVRRCDESHQAEMEGKGMEWNVAHGVLHIVSLSSLCNEKA